MSPGQKVSFNTAGCHPLSPTLCDSTVPCTETIVATGFSHVAAVVERGSNAARTTLKKAMETNRCDEIFIPPPFHFSIPLISEKPDKIIIDKKSRAIR
jgi:hypothetical protein